MSLVITVRGEHESRHRAERGIVHLAVALDGADHDEVFHAAATTSDAVRNLIDPLAASGGAITRWSSDTVRVTSQRPWNNAGEQLPLVHSAAIDFTARFREFDALAEFIERVSTLEFTRVNYVTWELTHETQLQAQTQARTRAVQDAVSKAREYAASVGLSEVSATDIADPGMLSATPATDSRGMMAGAAAMRMGGMHDGAAPLTLKPEDISVSAAVEARFNAS